jgi:glycosyltransferase involved in cell wall biosynthesis
MSQWAREKVKMVLARLKGDPKIDWQPVDGRVELSYVPDSGAEYMPDADVLFATSWHTVRSVLECPDSKGEKCYFIQGYESYHAAKELVDATWRTSLRKIVIAKWMMEFGESLGCEKLTYIPNAINHDLYRPTRAIEGRPRQVAMLVSTTQIKGSADGIQALEMVRRKFPDLKAELFGVSRPQSWIPDWANYRRNPPQDILVNEIYNGSSLFLAPSWTEGSPLPPLEAAACGCAVVATDIGGFREYIQHGVNGLLSPIKDPQALADNMCFLLSNEPERVRLAEAAHEFARGLDWERSTNLMEAFIRQATERAGTSFDVSESRMR